MPSAGPIPIKKGLSAGEGFAVLCESCGHLRDALPYHSVCPLCSGSLTFEYARKGPWPVGTPASGMWRYREWLPVAQETLPVTLHEGQTPLLKAHGSHPFKLYLKNETVNPTGSHKDRALSVAMTRAVECGFTTCILYSDGSAALSSAAYAARAGLRNIAVVPMGAAESRLYPLAVYNSGIIEFAGSSAEALDWVHEASRILGLYETSTYRQANPYGAEGMKTISYEIFEQLGAVPDWLVVAVGGGGTLAGIWRGFLELRKVGLTSSLPRLVGVLPMGYRLLELGMQRGVTSEHELRALANFPLPHTAQVKIAMQHPPDGIDAIQAVRDSGGCFAFAADNAAWAAQARLGAQEGIYAEVSSTVALVAIDQLQAQGAIQAGEIVVAVICGSGFRETAAVASPIPVRRERVDRATGITKLEALIARGGND